WIVTVSTSTSPIGSTPSSRSPLPSASCERRNRCARPGRGPILNVSLTDRSIAQRQAGAEEKRRQILDAAVRVFARRGFHTSRVGDIAEEAGVAHGLLYHYFDSKDAVLQAVFQENWNVLIERIGSVEETDEPAVDQLRHVAA